MVFANKYAKLFLEKFPRFKNSVILEETIEMFVDNGTHTNVNVDIMFTALSRYLCNEVIPNNPEITSEEKDIFDSIEHNLALYNKYPPGTEE